jgi:DNA polymerase
MTGFFTKHETQSTDRLDGKKYTCYSCGLYRTCVSPKMEPYGNFKKKILNIGDAPTEIDDDKGRPFQGKAGRLLERTYAKYGIDLFEDCLSINAVNCLPKTSDGEARVPTNKEIECCRRSVFSYIEKYKPKVIVLFGGQAVYSIIAHRWKKDLKTINEWRGWIIPDQEIKAWICPTFHPAYVDKMEKKEVYNIWEDDLLKIAGMVDTPLYIDKEPEIIYLKNLRKLTTIPDDSIISIDYETTGLKPHGEGHTIVCASVALNENKAYVFEMPKDEVERDVYISLLKNNSIKKMAHNLKFEENWSFGILKTRVRGWDWDSMLAAHILDNRSGVTGLKFQTYVNFGIIDYSSHLERWLGTEGKSANEINKAQEFFSTSTGRLELMKYCALDTIYQYRLANKQKLLFDELPF